MFDLLQMLAILAVLYILYAATLKRWNYSTEAERVARRNVLKQRGMSKTFYFIHAKTFLFLNILSGGLFNFFWLFKQWAAVSFGFRRLDGTPLRYGPFLRTIFGLFSFFKLAGIINRTCEYTRHAQALPAFFWGTVWVASFVSFFFVSGWYKAFAYLVWCYVPTVLQDKVNVLTSQEISPRPKITETIAAVLGLACTAACTVFVRSL